jgi:hypothetical protein
MRMRFATGDERGTRWHGIDFWLQCCANAIAYPGTLLAFARARFHSGGVLE